MTEPGNEDERAELEAILEEIERMERLLRDSMDFVNDDSNLTDSGIAAREGLLRDIETIEQDLEAVRQEHRRG